MKAAQLCGAVRAAVGCSCGRSCRGSGGRKKASLQCVCLCAHLEILSQLCYTNSKSIKKASPLYALGYVSSAYRNQACGRHSADTDAPYWWSRGPACLLVCRHQSTDAQPPAPPVDEVLLSYQKVQCQACMDKFLHCLTLTDHYYSISYRTINVQVSSLFSLFLRWC